MLNKSLLRLNFAGQIFLIFFVLLVAFQFFSSWIVYGAARGEAQDRIEERLNVAGRIFDQEFSNRSRYLKNSVNIISQDWAFRQAVGSGDANTIRDVLNSFSDRIDSDLAVFKGIDDEVLVSTLAIPETEISAIDAQELKNLTQRLIVINNEIYLSFFQSVRSPTPLGTLIMGFKVDNALAEYFKNITELDTSFIIEQSSQTLVVATTLDEELVNLQKIIPSEIFNDPDKKRLAMLPDEHDIMRDIKLIGHMNDGMLYAVQQESTAYILDKFKRWWYNILWLFVVIFFVLGGVALLLSNSITRPIRELLRVSHNISSGDYEQNVEVNRNDEIGDLAKEFQIMQGAIRVRQEEILYRADHSALLGLHNREKFINLLTEAIKSPSCNYVCVLVINLKRFRDINDTLGHHLGDKILIAIGERLKTKYPFENIAHIGADQFAVFVHTDSIEGVNRTAVNVEQSFDEPFYLEELMLSLSANIGVSVFPQDGESSESLLRFAEIALNQGKDRHKDIAFYDSSQDRHSVQQLTLMGQLPAAIKNNELVLFYQPTVDLTTTPPYVSKVEALVRWIHPVYGFIPPDDFISLAEQTGSITDLTNWVLESAIAQCAAWEAQGLLISVAVNLSPIDISRGNLESVIPRLLAQYNVSSESLVLEITESAVVQDPEQAKRVLCDLKALGLRLSVDDYGTGYSSLSQLKLLPVDQLKIDKSFVMSLPVDSDDAVIVESTIKLGHTMGLKVVAEGIENKEALAFLVSAGCDYAQGYFISKPLPVKECTEWLATHQHSVCTLLNEEAD